MTAPAKLPNCPACGSDRFMRLHHSPDTVSCNECEFETDWEKWRDLAEMAAKARAWDQIRHESEEWNDSADAVRVQYRMDEKLVYARKRAGLT